MEEIYSWTMITIEKLNEATIRIYGDSGIESELRDHFTFEVPGAKFTPKFKAKMWDGKIRLYDIQRKTLMRGLYDYVVKFCERNAYDFEVVGDPGSITDEKPETIKEFVEWLNPCSRGNPIEVREYQHDAICYAIRNERTLLLSPTASGKSLIIYSTMRYHLEQGRKCIIIVPTTSLVEQMYTDFADYSTGNGWRVDRNCQKLYSGFSKEFQSNVLITTWQSIYKQPPAWFKQFDVVFGDEAHLFKANSLTTVMNKMTDVRYRIGTTGTIDNKNAHKLVLEGVFGAVHKVITTKELMDNNQVANLKITCLMLKYDNETRELLKSATYQNEMQYIIAHERRNKIIRNLAISCTGNTLVLFQMVEKHGKILHRMILDKVGDGRKVFFIYGGTDVDAREAARKIADELDDAIIIASFGVFSTGVNIPSIENVIFASPSKSKIRNLQSIGRGLRLKSGKTHCNLYDISDDLSWKSKKNHTLNHFTERLKIYSEEQFKYKIVEINLD
jgi:superfamily II DNA or RNA helicase